MEIEQANPLVNSIPPLYATVDSAGADLSYAGHMPVVLKPNERKLLSTGWIINVGRNRVGLICPRSGLALKHGITVLNAPGVIDADYRGEVKVILWNTSDVNYTIHPGDRIAQIVVVNYKSLMPIETTLDDTARGDGGFGHSGC